MSKLSIKIPQFNTSILLNYTFIFYAFTISISRAGIVFATSLLILLWITEGKWSEKIELFKKSHIVYLLFAFVVYTILSALWSKNLLVGLDYALKYWYFIAIPILFTSLKKEYLNYVISSFLIGMFVSELFSYGIFFELISWKDRLPSDPTPFMNHLQYSLFLAFTALLLLNKIFEEKNIYLRNFYIFYFLSATINLFINGGRTGQVAFLFTLLLVWLINIKNKLLALLIGSFFIFTIFGIGYAISPNFKDRVESGKDDISKIFDNQDYCTSIGQRIGMWIVAGNVIKDNIFFGTGAGCEIIAMHNEIKENHPDKMCIINNRLPHYHNDFIQIVVQLGIIGGFLFLAIFYLLLRLDIKDIYIKNTIITFVVVYFVSSQFELVFHAQFSMALFALFVGIFLAYKRIENENSI